MLTIVIINKLSKEGEVTVWEGSWEEVSPGLCHRSRILSASRALVSGVYCSWHCLVLHLTLPTELPVGTQGLCPFFLLLRSWHLPTAGGFAYHAPVSAVPHAALPAGKDFFHYPLCHSPSGCFKMCCL